MIRHIKTTVFENLEQHIDEQMFESDEEMGPFLKTQPVIFITQPITETNNLDSTLPINIGHENSVINYN